MQTPFPAYKGDEPYIFVCYAHADSEQVYSELACLHESGINVWYDEGIDPGTEWSDELAERIEHCSTFIYFVTPSSTRSEY